MEQEPQIDWLRELGPARIGRVEAEAAVIRIELLGELLDGLGPGVRRQRQLALAARGLEPIAHSRRCLVSRLVDFGPLLRPRVCHGGTSVRNPGDPWRSRGGK